MVFILRIDLKTFKMSEVVQPPESVYNLIPREDVHAHKSPRYVSKHRPAVLLETKSNKHAMRTMGPAAVEVPSPRNYLKKRSKESTSPENTECSKGARHTCSQRRPPVPTRTNNPLMGVYTEKNLIRATTAVTLKPKPACVDTNKGNKQLLENSGLIPMYVNKKDYGEVPEYLRQRNKEEQRVQEEYKNFVKEQKEQAAMKNLSEERRQAVLEGLKKKWDRLHHEYQCLPLITETMSQRSHKESLEAKMTQVEKDIKLIERFQTIYVSN